MSDSLYLRDLVQRLDAPAPSLEVQRSYLEQHPRRENRQRSRNDGPTRTTHPLEHACWKSSRRRCTNQSDPSWRYYGALGIRFHEPWLDPVTGFRQFLKDMGPRPSANHMLGRRNRNGHYEPGNCVWKLKRDARVGIRSDRKYEEDSERTREVLITADRKDATPVEVKWRNGLICVGNVKMGPNQADQLALALVRMAAELRNKRHE